MRHADKLMDLIVFRFGVCRDQMIVCSSGTFRPLHTNVAVSTSYWKEADMRKYTICTGESANTCGLGRACKERRRSIGRERETETSWNEGKRTCEGGSHEAFVRKGPRVSVYVDTSTVPYDGQHIVSDMARGTL